MAQDNITIPQVSNTVRFNRNHALKNERKLVDNSNNFCVWCGSMQEQKFRLLTPNGLRKKKFDKLKKFNCLVNSCTICHNKKIIKLLKSICEHQSFKCKDQFANMVNDGKEIGLPHSKLNKKTQPPLSTFTLKGLSSTPQKPAQSTKNRLSLTSLPNSTPSSKTKNKKAKFQILKRLITTPLSHDKSYSPLSNFFKNG